MLRRRRRAQLLKWVPKTINGRQPDTKTNKRGITQTEVCATLQLQEIFEDSPTVRMLFIKEFGMELYAEEWARGVLHGLNS